MISPPSAIRLLGQWHLIDEQWKELYPKLMKDRKDAVIFTIIKRKQWEREGRSRRWLGYVDFT